MAARCFGFSIVLWCFWAAFVALMRVRELPRDKCACLLVSCTASRQFVPARWQPNRPSVATLASPKLTRAGATTSHKHPNASVIH